jgi:hypothetical protein
MITYNPTVKINISGSEIATFELNTSFVLSNKIEKSYEIPYAIVAVEQGVDYTDIVNAKLLVFSSANAFTIHCVRTFTIPGPSTYDADFTIPNSGGNIPIILNTTAAFLSGLKEIFITNDSSVTIKVNTSFYGEYIAPA